MFASAFQLSPNTLVQCQKTTKGTSDIVEACLLNLRVALIHLCSNTVSVF